MFYGDLLPHSPSRQIRAPVLLAQRGAGKVLGHPKAGAGLMAEWGCPCTQSYACTQGVGGQLGNVGLRLLGYF